MSAGNVWRYTCYVANAISDTSAVESLHEPRTHVLVEHNTTRSRERCMHCPLCSQYIYMYKQYALYCRLLVRHDDSRVDLR